MIYCIDTSAMIDAGLRHYPADLFPAFWNNMENLANAGRLKAPFKLIDELEKQSEEWRAWVYARSDQIIIPPDGPYLTKVSEVVEQYVQLGADAEKLTGDPFFVAFAAHHGMTLLTSEKPNKGAVKIPKVCNTLGVQTTNLLDFMRREGWRF